MNKKILAAMLSGVGLVFVAEVAQATVIESCDSGAWGAGWINASSAGTVTSAAAHGGGYGVNLDGASWTYNTSLSFVPGESLSAWVMPTAGSAGRVYLGFAASSTGAESFVGATNTNDIRFQDNPGYGFTELNTSPQTWTDGQWHLMTVDWLASGTAVGKLYASDGTTLLDSVSQTGLTGTGTGIALRGFGGWYVDTVSVAKTVPEPATVALMGLGLAGLGWARRRKS